MNNIDKLKKAVIALQSLESYGYKEQVVNVGDVKIVLAPLTVNETIDVFEASGKYNDIDASTQKLKVEVIARSIIKVDDVDFDPMMMFDQKLQIVSSFGDELVDYLFDQYCILDKVVKGTVEKKMKIDPIIEKV